MKNILHFFAIFGLIAVISACDNETEVDTQQPEISFAIEGGFPQQCDTAYLGEPLLFKVKFTDNTELKSYKVDIHNNFDHHTHGSDNMPCEYEPDKVPANPFFTNEVWDIGGTAELTVSHQQIVIPDDVDTGDYHLMVYVTDHAGNQSWKAVDFKILPKD